MFTLSRRAPLAIAVAMGWLAVHASGCTSLLGGLPSGEAADGSVADGQGDESFMDTNPGPDGAEAATDASHDGASGEACATGASCVPTNACHKGKLDCSTGTAVCTDTGSNASNGTPCGTNMFCDNGTCSACTSGASCTPTNVCHVGSTDCSTGTAVCTDTGNDVTNGTSCGSNMVCEMGVCSTCTTGGACTPAAKPCDVGSLQCSGSTPVCTDTGSTAANGTPCGTNMVCDNGSCNSCTKGASCMPTNPCHQGAVDCSTGAPVCTDTGNDVTNGTACGSNQVCLAGTCTACTQGASCPPANPCHTGTLNCSTGTPTCTDTGSNASNGTTCGTNMVCDNGSCNACTKGASCVPTNPCHQGSVDCSTGVAVCTDSGNNALNGTSCGTNMVCDNGSCTMCTTGASCTPANACHTGTLSCTTGMPVCNDSGNPVMNGTSCGTNAVCDNGSCNACTQSAACTPTNICDTGTTDCSTGAPVCKDSGQPNTSANGTTCGSGMVCYDGACDTQATLTIGPTSWNYGSIAPGTSSGDQTFSVQNAGQVSTGTLGVSLGGNTPAQFVVSSDTCSNMTLAAGGSCAVKVHFSPSLAGPYSATLTVTASPGGTASAQLAGTSGAPCGNFLSDSSTVALWHFDEGSGLSTADATGNGHAGQLGGSTTANSNDPTWVAGRFSKALFYAAASSQYVTGSGSNSWPSGAVTVEFWEKATSPFGNNGYSQPFTAGFICVDIQIDSFDTEFGVGDGNNWSFADENTMTLVDGNWHYVAYTYDGVNQVVYMDGVQLGAKSPSPAIALTSASGYYIGGRPSNTFFSGTLDEMRLSNVARTPGQIANYYASASTCP